ncbi:putative metal-dependent hydrolase [Gottschalkia purinilytica]|uniref:Putative metal-dependent hydrolase n=1 Tax=Gottschalkia purinilytica TaxID=1503 RepID=A0A0L0W6C5_GOTPU|nr:cyclase family protein [Gottschalkia purinilytica]KNF07032.1 putative metal-dependent hydrolase [Gottschalkia purinilytica]
MGLRLIDLTQEIYEGMPLFGIHQKTFIMTNQTYEQNMKATGSKTLGFYARNLLISEHCGTHSDGINEFKPGGASIENMPLEHFWGSAICLDLSHKRYPEYIEPKDLEEALAKSGQEIRKGDIVLMYTGLFNRAYGTPDYENYYTGLSYEGAKWLAERGVMNIGVDAPAIDQTPDDLDFSGHLVCGEYNITNTENLCNLDKVVNKRFLYMGLPLKIRGGTGSPIRAVALLED